MGTPQINQRLESTQVIFTSDHGSQLFDRGVQNTKHTFLDASWRVPLIARWPGVLPAGAEATFASTVDLTATILSAAAARVPRSFAGYDLVAPFKAGPARGAPAARSNAVAGALFRGLAVATSRYKLTYFPERDEGSLVDLLLDPRERTDLWDDPDHAHVRHALHVALLNWRVMQDDLHYEATTVKPTDGGSSKQAFDAVAKLDGNRAERRLQAAAAAVDAMRPRPP